MAIMERLEWQRKVGVGLCSYIKGERCLTTKKGSICTEIVRMGPLFVTSL